MTSGPLSQLPPAVARITCSDETHALRWEGGDLVALDHDDPEGERTLTALGGKSCACLDVLGAWTRQREDAVLLSALSRGPQDPVRNERFRPRPFPVSPATAPARNVLSARRGGGMWRGGTASGSVVSLTVGAAPGGAMGSPSSDSPTREDDVVLLAGLGHEMTLRLVATVTAALLDRLKSEDGRPARPALEVSLFGRASCALRTWLGAPELSVDLDVAEPDAEPSLGWGAGGSVHLALPLEWVMTVWGCDLTMIAGRFCLGVVESNGPRTTLMSVGSDLGPPRPLAIEMP